MILVGLAFAGSINDSEHLVLVLEAGILTCSRVLGWVVQTYKLWDVGRRDERREV